MVVAILIFFNTSLSKESGSKNGVVKPILTVLNKTIDKLSKLKRVESTIIYNFYLKFD